MGNKDSEFENLYREVEECSDCRKGNRRIGELPPDQFRFHWKPYWFGDPPFPYIFLAWEPSFKAVEPEVTYPTQGSFNQPLQYAIRKFFLADPGHEGFLITNMAKCTIKTGPLCNETRNFRFETCKRFLKGELTFAANPETQFVSIGDKPFHFINANKALYGEMSNRIHKISHYGRRRFGYFSKQSREQASEFAEFRQKTESDYRGFFEHRYQTDDEFGSYYKDLEKNLDGDLEMLFVWFLERQRMPH